MLVFVHTGHKNIKAERHDAKTEFEAKVTEHSVSILSLSLEDEGTDRWAMEEEYSLRRLTR